MFGGRCPVLFMHRCHLLRDPPHSKTECPTTMHGTSTQSILYLQSQNITIAHTRFVRAGGGLLPLSSNNTRHPHPENSPTHPTFAYGCSC